MERIFSSRQSFLKNLMEQVFPGVVQNFEDVLTEQPGVEGLGDQDVDWLKWDEKIKIKTLWPRLDS